MTREEFDKTVCKRVVTGFGSFGGSTLGMVVGQAAIPIPFVGGLIGSVVGGLAGSLAANNAQTICTAVLPYREPFEFAPTLCRVRPHTFRVRPHQV